MKKIQFYKNSIWTALFLVSATTITTASPSYAASYGSVSHIHNIKTFADKALLGTHEGLFEYQAANSKKRLGSEGFDVMGLASYNNIIYASGHPGAKSKLPSPTGLISSSDSGKTWKQISLQGEVDFHMLEVGKNDIYGADSGSGQLMYSSDRGRKWQKLGENKYSDIAVLSTKTGSAIAVSAGRLLQTTDAFKTTTTIKSNFKPNSIEVVGTKLYASSAKAIYRSVDNGKSWKKIATLPTEISSISVNTKLFVAVTANAIFLSRDGGKNFKS